QAEDGIRDRNVTGVQTCALPILDYGQPLHAFDYDKFDSKKLTVRLANEGEKLTTLDGEERELKATDLVIADGDRAIALAGVMGSEDTEVSDKTQTVVLEAAIFNSSKIRKTARRENLHSEASQRFERGINVATVQEALDAAAQLIADFGDGQVVSRTLEINHVDPES